MPKRPNILFIHVDQMHWQAMSAYGNPYVKTPEMERIASDGVFFRASDVAMPQCCHACASWYNCSMCDLLNWCIVKHRNLFWLKMPNLFIEQRDIAPSSKRENSELV